MKDPLVLGIGFAATRDLNAFFRYDKKDDSGTPNPVSGNIRWAVSEGSSQSGTFLRAFIGLGFNQDEANRIVWDGSNPHIASRVLDMNRRFAEPGGTVSLYELGMEAPLWWADWDDTARGRGKGGLLDRCRATNTCPKIMETFGSAEIYGLRASPMLVGTDAKADIPLPDNVRRYFFPGVTHGVAPHWRGDLLLVLSGLAYASYTLLGRAVLLRHSALAVTARSIVWGAIAMAPLAAIEWLAGARPSLDVRGVGGALYLAIVITALGYLVWNWGLGRIGAPRAAIFITLQPIAGAVLGVLLLHEPLTAFTLAGGVLIVSGLWLTVTGRR